MRKIAKRLHDDEVLSYNKQISSYLNDQEEIYDKEFVIANAIAELGDIPILNLKDSYDSVSNYMYA